MTDPIVEILDKAFEEYVDCINETKNQTGLCFPKTHEIAAQIREVTGKMQMDCPYCGASFEAWQSGLFNKELPR